MEQQRRVAVIGAGIAGMGAAYTLSKDPRTRITVYEERATLGGHANTVELSGTPLDTGFLVYNENTYPNLCGMFEELGVPTEPSDMSFAVSLSGRSVEWSSNGLSGLFAHASNAVSPRMYSMLSDMMRFNTQAPLFLEAVARDPGGAGSATTMREFLDAGGYGVPFRDLYLLPQVAAVWSASGSSALDFPATTLLRFFVNHSLLQALDRPRWRTVSCRSASYLRRLAAALPPATTTLLTGTPVASVRRTTHPTTGATLVLVTDAGGRTLEYDDVVFGAHPPEVLRMLGEDASAEERAALGGFVYASNTAYLHEDPAFMPASRSAWASWNYMGKGRAGSSPPTASTASTASTSTSTDSEPCCVTYWLNTLQNLPATLPPLFVTLNPSPSRTPSRVHRQFAYSHPQYTLDTIAAQKALEPLQGVRGLSFAGAYLGYGFHEDGLTSGIRAAVRLTGVEPPWWGTTLYNLPPAAAAAAVAAAAAAAAATPSSATATTTPRGDQLLNTPWTTPTATLAKASGGPFWVDNLGNGGPVGKATRSIVGGVEAGKRGFAHRVLEERSGGGAAGAAGAAGFQPFVCLTPSTTPLLSLALTSLTSGLSTALSLGGSGAALAWLGHRYGGAKVAPLLEVLKGVVQKVGGGGGTPWAGAVKGVGGVLAGVLLLSATHTFVTVRSQEGGAQAAAQARKAAAAAEEAQGLKERGGGVGGGAGSITTITPSSSLLPSDLVGSIGDIIGYTVVSLPNDVLAANAVFKATAKVPSGKRVYKSYAVGKAIAQALNMAAGAGAGAGAGPLPSHLPSHLHPAFTTPLRHYMGATVGGGYTGAPLPLQHPSASLPSPTLGWVSTTLSSATRAAGAYPVLSFLRAAIVEGCLLLRTPDGEEHCFGNPSALAPLRARIRVYSWGFFLRVAAESDLGLARSFIAGDWGTDDLTGVFNVFIANRDNTALSTHGLWTAWIGLTLNFLTFTFRMDNSVANSRNNIHAHYDLSNDLFTSFLDPGTMMYSCGFFDTERRVLEVVDLHTTPVEPSASAGGVAGVAGAQRASLEEAEEALLNSMPLPAYPPRAATATASTPASTPTRQHVEVVYKGTLEEAQIRKLDHLIARAQVQKEDRVLDLGFGWGGLSIRLAESVGCRVHGITLSQEQHDLALERVKARGLAHLVTFEIVDYRVFAAAHPGEFNKIISIEMIEAVGHNYFPSFMGALDRLLAPGGIIALQAITMPESRYPEYLKTCDFINTIIFPGGMCPSLAALTDAMMKNTGLILNSVDQFALHYGETLRRWRANFNAALDTVVRPLGFDDQFIRTWNYYLCYCEAGFSTQTLGLQVLTFARPNTRTFLTNQPSGRLAEPLGPLTGTPLTIPRL